MPIVDVTRTYLELRSAGDLRTGRTPAEPVALERRNPIRAQEYLALYRLVGDRWLWRDRLAWTDDALDEYLASPLVHVWVARVGRDVAGYFELRQGVDHSVEIMYFGLAPRFIGRGIGGWLLTRACETGFSLGARSVVLNTCTLDGPHAMPNYLARGFRIVRSEEYQVNVAESDLRLEAGR